MKYDFLDTLEQTLEQRKQTADVDTSYVARLYAKGTDAIGKKIGEEATEVVMAAKDCDFGGSSSTRRLTHESADLLFHLLVLLRKHDLSFADIVAELKKRHS